MSAQCPCRNLYLFSPTPIAGDSALCIALFNPTHIIGVSSSYGVGEGFFVCLRFKRKTGLVTVGREIN
jgi:hypothetical protein